LGTPSFGGPRVFGAPSLEGSRAFGGPRAFWASRLSLVRLVGNPPLDTSTLGPLSRRALGTPSFGAPKLLGPPSLEGLVGNPPLALAGKVF
jgi:hypothetical protein